ESVHQTLDPMLCRRRPRRLRFTVHGAREGLPRSAELSECVEAATSKWLPVSDLRRVRAPANWPVKLGFAAFDAIRPAQRTGSDRHLLIFAHAANRCGCND